MSLSDKLKLTTLHPAALPALNRIAAAAERVHTRWPDVVVEPPERDRDRLVAEMLRRVQTDDWHQVRTSFVVAAARALFDAERCTRTALAQLRKFYFEEISASDNTSFLAAMVSVYISTFNPEADHTNNLALVLDRVRGRLDANALRLLSGVPDLFRPKTVPRAIGRMMLQMEHPWTGLKSIGVRSPHAGGLMDYAHEAFVAQLAPKLASRATMERLLDWLKPPGQTARRAGAAEAINALLEPWRNRSPSADDERYLTTSLIDFYGDPRVARDRSGPWAGVAEPLLAIVLRWLTGENIRFFLDVVSAVEDSHMWEPRRKFWLGLHKQERVDAAWVAFSSQAADYARRKGADRQLLKFGRQTARQNTSLLILKIGKKIVIEGSHSYKVHIFRQDAPKAPKLWQSIYD